MKKKLFLGIGLICIVFAITMAKVDVKFGEDYSGLQMSNIEAYASDSEGGKWKCYGPKPNDHCLCENTVECKDLHGCN